MSTTLILNKLHSQEMCYDKVLVMHQKKHLY